MRVVSLEIRNLVVITSYLIDFRFDCLVFGFIKCGVVFIIAALGAEIGTSYFDLCWPAYGGWMLLSSVFLVGRCY